MNMIRAEMVRVRTDELALDRVVASLSVAFGTDAGQAHAMLLELDRRGILDVAHGKVSFVIGQEE